MAKKRFWNRIRFLLNLPKSLPLAWKLIQDSRLPLKNKLYFIVLALGYLIFPFDLILDVPLIGQLDDFAIFMFLFNWFLNKVPTDILQEYGWETE